MGQTHPSTPAPRVQSASSLVAQAGEYGVVTARSRARGVSRPTLYAWRVQRICCFLTIRLLIT